MANFIECFRFTITEEERNKYFVEQEVLYRDYKSKSKEFQHYATKDNSYNAEKKTIVLYVPKYRQLAEEIAKIKREAYKKFDRREEPTPTYMNQIEGLFGYETDVLCGWYMMKSATWWFVKATDEELEERTKQDDSPYGFHRTAEEIEADCKIVELVREYRSKI